MKGFFVLLISLSAIRAAAFPEMFRHGYTHCTACHTNITGGGLLNEYGRSLSAEIISQKTLFGRSSAEGDEKYLSGLVDLPEGYLFGGDIRLLQTFVENKSASRGRFLIMQLALDFSVQVKSWARAFVSVGRVEPRKPEPTASDFITSPQHGVEFMLSPPDADERTTLRVGKFMPVYGILFQEHTAVTRRFLELQPGQERVAAELAWTSENYAVIATGIGAQTSFNTNIPETGGILQVSSAVGTTSKVGLNFYQTNRRKILGFFSQIAFSENIYGLLEVDQPTAPNGDQGLIEVFKLGYEWHQGLHFVGIQEFANLDIKESNPKFEAFSVGTQWFPRVHWDLYGLYRKERNTLNGNDFDDQVWLIGHYYL